MKKVIIYKNRVLTLIVFGLFFLGMLLPTSIQKIISGKLGYLGWAILIFLLVGYLLIQGSYNKIQVFIAILINAILIVFTLSTTLSSYSPGAYFSFFAFSLLICLDLKKVAFTNIFKYLLVGMSSLLILGVYLVVFKPYYIDNLLESYYAWGDPGTQYFMVNAREPALMFATHSIAGFYYFIFFLMNYRSYKSFRKLLYLIFSILFILAMILLRSVTGYGLAALAILIVSKSVFVTPGKAILISIVGVTIGVWAFFRFQPLWEAIFNLSIGQVFSSSGNGFIGRYSGNSMLSATIEYIQAHPFQPIGLGHNPELFYTDSGPIIYFLRGSIFLVGAMYLGVLGLFMNNSKRAMWGFLLFCIFMFFESGFPNLIYMRTIYLLPFIIAYFNYLKDFCDKNCRLYRRNAKPKFQI